VVARFLDDPKSEALANPKNCDPNLIKFKKLLELWQCFLVRMNTVTAVQPEDWAVSSALRGGPFLVQKNSAIAKFTSC
jgi:hypothetical protein